MFGSRARGDYREDSDWDTLIVTKKKLDNRLEDVFGWRLRGGLFIWISYQKFL